MSGRLTTAAASGGHGGAGSRGGQLDSENGKDKDETESRDSRLIEVADDTEVAINGNKFRIGDLIPDFSRNLNLVKARDGLIGGPSTVGGSDRNSQSIVNLGCHLQEAQVKSNVSLSSGRGPVGLDCSENVGPFFSFGSFHPESLDVGLGVKDPNQLMEVQVLNATETETQKEKSVRVLPISLKGNSRGRKRGTLKKTQISVSGVGRENDKAGSFSRTANKRRMDVLEQGESAERAEKYVMLS
ncbi:hypothetical protein RHGRI_033891 [Rhododendron griersonianum]|uniref:Uncharacterized protein n=1 Tax=Rhododendron griersonianum TaxID=479676 RepID=A0AAV6HYX8_9ERIC|nr:hypothetical protein RHGRI_033891 [Rhododendron griersonianum]